MGVKIIAKTIEILAKRHDGHWILMRAHPHDGGYETTLTWCNGALTRAHLPFVDGSDEHCLIDLAPLALAHTTLAPHDCAPPGENEPPVSSD